MNHRTRDDENSFNVHANFDEVGKVPYETEVMVPVENLEKEYPIPGETAAVIAEESAVPVIYDVNTSVEGVFATIAVGNVDNTKSEEDITRRGSIDNISTDSEQSNKIEQSSDGSPSIVEPSLTKPRFSELNIESEDTKIQEKVQQEELKTEVNIS